MSSFSCLLDVFIRQGLGALSDTIESGVTIILVGTIKGSRIGTFSLTVRSLVRGSLD